MTESGRNTKADILQAALEQFAEKGYHSASMSAIAERAGVGKGTLYWHFSSKEDLFQMMILEHGQALFERLHTLVSSEHSPEVILREIIQTKVQFIVDHSLLSQVLFNDFQVTNDDFKEMLIQKHIEMVQAIEKVMARGIDAGIFCSGSARQMAITLIGMTNSVNSYFLFQDQVEVTPVAESIYQMILQGIQKPSK